MDERKKVLETVYHLSAMDKNDRNCYGCAWMQSVLISHLLQDTFLLRKLHLAIGIVNYKNQMPPIIRH
ncbi:hypothetical protein A4A49_65694 [Nicotiana attenuata]|uniref:Uncharacterized protein n=1 Tax=Nicotiana attenuata TaxID=49451 RepID=A0A314KVC3_NICAT|nr:hypothetical protein A4A49_65694 [Nicotiana attenuata]